MVCCWICDALSCVTRVICLVVLLIIITVIIVVSLVLTGKIKIKVEKT